MKKQQIESCSICSQLADKEYGFQKFGSNYPDTYLPPAVDKLVVVADFRPGSERKSQLRQCPECALYYHYFTDYEYFAGGSEDEQFLERLGGEEAMEYLKKAGELK
jgi:hypothetical protein